jgi:AcrR family transcriptional regulator
MLTLSTYFAKMILVSRKQRKPAYHHGNLRAALIEGGVQLIQEEGLRALTLREIGNRLSVSRSAAYRHFTDKAALLSAIGEAGFIEFGNVLKEAKEGAVSDFASRMDAMGVAYVRFAREHRAHFEVMFGEPPAPGSPAAEAGARAFGILEQTIREGQERGEVRPGDSRLLARAVWAMSHGISTLRLDGDAAEPRFIRFGSGILRTGLENGDHTGGPVLGTPQDQKQLPRL